MGTSGPDSDARHQALSLVFEHKFQFQVPLEPSTYLIGRWSDLTAQTHCIGLQLEQGFKVKKLS